MPCVIGCIDGTIIPIGVPFENEEQYVDQDGQHSINIMVIIGPDLSIFYCNSLWPGSMIDAKVLQNWNISHQFEEGCRPMPFCWIMPNRISLYLYLMDNYNTNDISDLIYWKKIFYIATFQQSYIMDLNAIVHYATYLSDISLPLRVQHEEAR
uniref:DDE Tnp4 domain-containing protein n=1 Tax=Romanomermis culicivorax TaxID=13658 RepID=A0A915K7E3_ROMCU